MNLEQLIQALIGGAFGLRVFDSNRNLLARVAYGVVAWDLLSRAWANQEDGAFSRNGVGRLAPGQVTAEPGSPLKFSEKRVRTISERVAYVIQQTLNGVKDPVVYKRARAILTRRCNGDWCVKERDHRGELTALFADIRQSIRYTWDPVSYDAFQSSRRTLELQAGDCDDYTSLLGAMVMSVGYKVRVRVVQTTGNTTYNHIYEQAQLPDGEWMTLDCSMPKPAGWEVPQNEIIKYKDYDVNG